MMKLEEPDISLDIDGELNLDIESQDVEEEEEDEDDLLLSKSGVRDVRVIYS